MESNSTRKTRSMQGKLVSNQISKEFCFSDPERKFKNLDTERKFSSKLIKSDDSAGGSGSKNPSDTAENLLKPKILATETDKEFLDLATILRTDPNNSKWELNNETGHKMENHGDTDNNSAHDEDLEGFLETPLAEADPQVTRENGKNFQKSGFMENSIFSPSSSSSKRLVGKGLKNKSTKTGLSSQLKTGNSEDKHMENQNLENPGNQEINPGLKGLDLTNSLDGAHSGQKLSTKGSRNEDVQCDPQFTFSSSPSDPTKPPSGRDKPSKFNDRKSSTE